VHVKNVLEGLLLIRPMRLLVLVVTLTICEPSPDEHGERRLAGTIIRLVRHSAASLKYSSCGFVPRDVKGGLSHEVRLLQGTTHQDRADCLLRRNKTVHDFPERDTSDPTVVICHQVCVESYLLSANVSELYRLVMSSHFRTTKPGEVFYGQCHGGLMLYF
jgi:hypothetical protein